MANSLAQYLADLQVQIKESESQLVFGEVISTSPLRVKYGEITLEDNFLFVEDGLKLTVGQKVPMLKTNRSQLFIVMLSKEIEHQEMTPQDILSAIKTVDGSGSGIDADLLDGKHASDFSLDGHTHAYAMPVTQIENVSVPASVEAHGVHSSTVRIYHDLGYVPKFVVITKTTKMGAGIQVSLFALNSSYIEVNFSRYSSFEAHSNTLALQFYGTGGTVIV